MFLKKHARYGLFPFLIFFLSCEIIDPGGLFKADSDVDERFDWSRNNPAPPAVEITGSEFSFLAVADTHYFDQSEPGEAFQLLGTITAPGDRFLIVDGDLVQTGNAAAHAQLLSDITSVGLPFYTAVGNHDIYHNGWKKYRESFGSSVYSLSLGEIRLICLDTANGTVGGKQWEWLKDELRAYTEPYCVIMTHANFFASGAGQLQQITDYEEVYALMDRFEKNGVDLVISGHAHKWDDRTINGVRYITLDTFREDDPPWHYYRIRFTGDKIEVDKMRF